MQKADNPKLTILLSLIFFIVLGFNLTKCKKAEEQPDENSTNHTVSKNEDMPGLLPIIHDSIPHLKKLFEAAMVDAQNPEPHEISHQLINLETDPNLVTKTINGIRHIKVVSWKLNPAWYPDSGKFNDSSRVIWVTIAPIIKDSCISFHKTYKDANMRLRQLLGLQPLTVETFFLELWVKPEDLFRPTPDNETNDHTCGLNLPQNVTPEYRQWFNNTRAFQYNDCTDSIFSEYGYPWTQLGYTYDWSPDNPSNVGLSEFVIKKNSDVYVSGKYSNKLYCASNE
ncbi:hypothetical protein ACU8DI_02110 [Psychroserpens sp. BH13MA-6]